MATMDEDEWDSCVLCLEPFDCYAKGERAPLSMPCCGNDACRSCVQRHYMSKAEEKSNFMLKWFPCPRCNTPKSLHIEHLPAASQSAMSFIHGA